MSAIDPKLMRFEELLPGGASWSHVLKRGTTLRITDLEGGSNVGALFYNFELLSERFNMPDTLKAQHVAKLTRGQALYSDLGRILVSIVEDTCGWHDPLGGCSSRAQVESLYGALSYQQVRNDFPQNGRDSFLTELGKYGMGGRDLVPNVNLFSRVSVDGLGGMSFVPGNSAPGAYVDLRAEMNTLVILNTCAHPLDDSPAYAPKPVQLMVFSSPPPGPEDVCRISCPENQRGFTVTERYFL